MPKKKFAFSSRKKGTVQPYAQAPPALAKPESKEGGGALTDMGGTCVGFRQRAQEKLELGVSSSYQVLVVQT